MKEFGNKYIINIFDETVRSGKYKALELSMMGGEPLLEFEKIKEISEWMWSREWPLKYIIFLIIHSVNRCRLKQLAG